MPVRFAAARSAAASPVARVLVKRTPGNAANDLGLSDPASNAVLRAALLHFAAYGMGAPAAARACSEDAFAAGDFATGEHWRTICRAFDRRLAATIVRDGSRPAVNP